MAFAVDRLTIRRAEHGVQRVAVVRRAEIARIDDDVVESKRGADLAARQHRVGVAGRLCGER